MSSDTDTLGTAARRAAATVLEILGTRLELGTIELQEERLRLAELALAAAAALFLVGNGLVLALLALAWWAGPERGAWVLGGAAAAMLATGAVALIAWRRLARSHRPLLAETLAQLRADARAIAGRP